MASDSVKKALISGVIRKIEEGIEWDESAIGFAKEKLNSTDPAPFMAVLIKDTIETHEGAIAIRKAMISKLMELLEGEENG